MRAMKKILVAFGILAGLLVAGNASAYTFINEFSFSLEGANAALQSIPLPGPYATVDIGILDSNSAIVTVTGNSFSTATYPTGQYLLSDFGLNLVNQSNISLVGNVSVTPASITASGVTFTEVASLGFDGFGTMNFALNDSQGGFTGGVLGLQFELANSANNWSSLTSLTDMLVGNTDGHPSGSYAADHIVAWNGDPAATQAIVTGWVATVPEPCTLFLLGGGALVGLAGYRRKRSKA